MSSKDPTYASTTQVSKLIKSPILRKNLEIKIVPKAKDYHAGETIETLKKILNIEETNLKIYNEIPPSGIFVKLDSTEEEQKIKLHLTENDDFNGLFTLETIKKDPPRIIIFDVPPLLTKEDIIKKIHQQKPFGSWNRHPRISTPISQRQRKQLGRHCWFRSTWKYLRQRRTLYGLSAPQHQRIPECKTVKIAGNSAIQKRLVRIQLTFAWNVQNPLLTLIVMTHQMKPL